MYHVIGTAITVSLLYLISFLFYRTGIFSQTFHRKVWNSVLALAFLFTAFAGIFMALQINFKWNIPFIRKLLQWHVEIGAGLGLVGLFHFLWHLAYFKNIFRRQENTGSPSSVPAGPVYSVSANLFMIGFTSTSVQILLIRELMNITGGYELITGVFLGSWLVSSAAGAAIAGRSALKNISRINLVFAAAPFVSVILLILMSKLFLGTGEIPSFLASMILTLILLIPFCLITGFAFIRLIGAARAAEGYIPGKSFSIETTGGITAGIVLSVMTAGFYNTYELILVIILLHLAYVLLTFYIHGRRGSLITRILFVLVISAAVIADPDIVFRQVLLPAVKVTETTDTPYGNITRGEYSGEQSTYYDQRLISYSDDAAEREEDVHYAMLQRKENDRVLLISGTLRSRLQEIKKYDPEKVVYVERDPGLLEYSLSDMKEVSSGLTVENSDAFRYVKKSGENFNTIIMLLSPPATLSLNRFYTVEFFRYAKLRLASGGVFLCSPGPNDNYFNEESLKLYSSIHNSLSTVFRNVVPVAGGKLYFIASDDEVSVSFCDLLKTRGIDNFYVGPSFLSDDLIRNKTAEIKALMDPGIKQNSLSFPIACFYYQSYNLSKSMNDRLPAIILLVIAFLLPVITVKRRNMIMYFSASALAGFEIIVLLTLQLTAGSMYQLTGLVIAAMMTGLAAGSGMHIRSLEAIDLRIKAAILIVFYAATALGFDLIAGFRGTFTPVILIVLSVILPAWMTGHIFRELTREKAEVSGTGKVYSADLAGSALGFILISGIAVPVLGIKNSIMMLAVLIAAGILFGARSKR